MSDVARRLPTNCCPFSSSAGEGGVTKPGGLGCLFPWSERVFAPSLTLLYFTALEFAIARWLFVSVFTTPFSATWVGRGLDLPTLSLQLSRDCLLSRHEPESSSEDILVLFLYTKLNNNYDDDDKF